MKKLLKINFIVCLIFLFSYSTTMANEEASYNVVQKNDIYEIRYYSDRLIVQVANKGDNNSFRKLFKYISGENKNSEKIAMTVPVTQTKKDDQMFMQFYLPSKFNRNTTPIPNNPDLEITTIPEGYFCLLYTSPSPRDPE